MNQGFWVVWSLMTIMCLVLLLPFLSKKVEEELEVFLLAMGLLSVSISGLWRWHLVREVLVEPVKITVAVLLAGLVFRALRTRLRRTITAWVAWLGYGPVLFLTVVGLGFASSLITAIIAALALAEIVSVLKLPRRFEVQVVVIACFSIGLGAVLTPVGEPLATIAVSKLQGHPYQADFFFLFKLLGLWVMPAILGLGAWVAVWKIPQEAQRPGLREDQPETLRGIVFRAIKTYTFVAALVLLGAGFTPVVDRYLLSLNPSTLYWLNMTSAVLDNATLAAAEINPRMSLDMIRYLILGLLISGGMLIPGNIPNIICAGKLSIRSQEWARVGLPLGLGLMAGYFAVLALIYP